MKIRLIVMRLINIPCNISKKYGCWRWSSIYLAIVTKIKADVNDTLFFSYLGFKSIKIRVTNDLIKFQKSKIRLTELAYALEEVVVSPYQLTGYLEIDARNIPLSKTYRYNIANTCIHHHICQPLFETICYTYSILILRFRWKHMDYMVSLSDLGEFF